MNKNDVKPVLKVCYERLIAEYGFDSGVAIFKESVEEILNGDMR